MRRAVKTFVFIHKHSLFQRLLAEVASLKNRLTLLELASEEQSDSSSDEQESEKEEDTSKSKVF